MLTKELKAIFAQMLYNDKDMLFGECGPSLSKVEKQEKWIEIFIKLNAMGANLPDYKVSPVTESFGNSLLPTLSVFKALPALWGRF